ncbi:MAG: DUF4326 domain-containing protein [Martelella sp.]|uniref:DUF4326 domain-containing protein n=1 Tax=Martelella sp. TaxID=1969699 RepID=UPI003242DBC2
MTTPVRLRLSRAKGFNLQRHSLAKNGLPAIVVARPGLFGNPFVVGRHGDAAQCVDYFKRIMAGEVVERGLYDIKPDALAQVTAAVRCGERLTELKGFNLACWCRLDAPCHADALLKLACEDAP